MARPASRSWKAEACRLQRSRRILLPGDKSPGDSRAGLDTADANGAAFGYKHGDNGRLRGIIVNEAGPTQRNEPHELFHQGGGRRDGGARRRAIRSVSLV
jgi:hypothetical protein